jgi:hypothetical protein
MICPGLIYSLPKIYGKKNDGYPHHPFEENLIKEAFNRLAIAARMVITLGHVTPTNQGSQLWKRWILKNIVN